MPHDDKRLVRKTKKAIKRVGNKHRRHDLKRNLRDHPEEAHFDAEDLGGRESSRLNGYGRKKDS